MIYLLQSDHKQKDNNDNLAMHYLISQYQLAKKHVFDQHTF